MTLIIPFKPSTLMPPTPITDSKKLGRWCEKLGILGTGRGITVLQYRLLDMVAFFHSLKVPILYRDETVRNSPLVPIPTEELDSILKLRSMQPRYDRNRDLLRKAYENRVILEGFKLSQFLDCFSSVRIKNGHPFGHRERMLWKTEDGPRLLVDDEGVILFLYLPGYLSGGYANDLGAEITELCQYVPPTPDVGTDDRRAQREVPQALRRSRRQADRAPLEPGEKDWRDELAQALAEDTRPRAGSCHHTIGWIPRGQFTHCDPMPSRELIAGRVDVRAWAATIHFYRWKEEVDLQINDLMQCLHPEFYRLMLQLRLKLRKHGALPPEMWEVWRSAFSFLSIGFNRQTEMHRDSAGMEGGLDALFLVGDFTGGNLYLQDFGLEIEWRSGDFCCFDGKIFSHGVQPWEGQERRCFIYFVHSNVMKHYGLPDHVDFPLLSSFAVANGFV